jgi:hypothetical protein
MYSSKHEIQIFLSQISRFPFQEKQLSLKVALKDFWVKAKHTCSMKCEFIKKISQIFSIKNIILQKNN